jgi:uncharacterized protein DUF222/HNH endonuclease
LGVSSLFSAVEELRASDVDLQTDEELEGDFVELQRAMDMLEAERLRRLAAIDRRRTYEREGFLSVRSWVAARFRVAASVASGMVRTARALQQMPETAAALASGDVSVSAVRILVEARQTNREEFASAEALLVNAARALPARELQQAVAHWQQIVDSRDALRESERHWNRRHLHVSPTIFGMVRIDGDLDPETGQTVIAALQAVQAVEARTADPDDGRTAPQRRADAMGVVCRSWLDRSDRPVVAGELPHVTVLVDVPALQGEPGGHAAFADAGVIHPEIARVWACDASLGRVVMRGRSEPLDVGRRTSVVPPAIRRAVMVRDRHCRFPGCDRPVSWCDCHHIVHWADGGPTAVGNLILLCRRHHRLVHKPGGFRLELEHGQPAFRTACGYRLTDRAPP